METHQPPVTFRNLVDRARRSGRKITQPPRTMAWFARRVGLTPAHIYALIAGQKSRGGEYVIVTAPSWTVAKIAQALDLPMHVVEEALENSRRLAMNPPELAEEGQDALKTVGE